MEVRKCIKKVASALVLMCLVGTQVVFASIAPSQNSFVHGVYNIAADKKPGHPPGPGIPPMPPIPPKEKPPKKGFHPCYSGIFGLTL